jgi:hypothetical protein
VKRGLLAELMQSQLCHGGWCVPAEQDGDHRDNADEQIAPVQPPPGTPTQPLDQPSDMLVRS